MAEFLSLGSLGIAYGKHVIAKDFDLRVDLGEIVTLSGPSGCGKSSILRAIAGLQRPVSGTIRMGGRMLEGPGIHVEPGDRHIGMVFQDPALFPHLTVVQNIAFGLGRRTPASEQRDRVDHLLDLLGLAGMGRRYPHELSGGQQQRVAFARAMAPRPSLLLMDEAFAGLDRLRKQELLPRLARIVREHCKAALIVSHDVEESLLLADRIVMMDQGAIVQEGSPGELSARPATAAVRAYFSPLPLHALSQ